MKNKEIDTKILKYYVDEAGDGVLFGHKGRDRLKDDDAQKFFILGMVVCKDEDMITHELETLRQKLLNNPLYSTIPSMLPNARKTACYFHAKDDHAEIRAKVFEFLTECDFKFYAVIKDMRKVRDYVRERNNMDIEYRYKPDELYDLTVRMLFKNHLHKHSRYEIIFAPRGRSDRTNKLRLELEKSRKRFLREHSKNHTPDIIVNAMYPHQAPCLQVVDYCLWALQRCYEKYEARFLHALWDKASVIHDVDCPCEKHYGKYFSKKAVPPNPEEIKKRWI